MSVSSATAGLPCAAAPSTSARANARASSSVRTSAPEPTLTSNRNRSAPPASFFERIDDTISGRLPTVAVASRSA